MNHILTFILGATLGALATHLHHCREDKQEIAELDAWAKAQGLDSASTWDGEDPLPAHLGSQVHVVKMNGRSPDEVARELSELVKQDLTTLARRNVPFAPQSGRGGLKSP